MLWNTVYVLNYFLCFIIILNYYFFFILFFFSYFLCIILLFIVYVHIFIILMNIQSFIQILWDHQLFGFLKSEFFSALIITVYIACLLKVLIMIPWYHTCTTGRHGSRTQQHIAVSSNHYMSINIAAMHVKLLNYQYYVFIHLQRGLFWYPNDVITNKCKCLVNSHYI